MESSNQTTGEPAYPVRFSVEYPDRELNRLTTAFRLIVAIPILIVAGTIGGHEGAYGGGHRVRIAGRSSSRRLRAAAVVIPLPEEEPPPWVRWKLTLRP